MVGDGPAGCAAAITCVLSGLRTTLVSGGARRCEFPESIHAGGIDLVHSLGVGDLSAAYAGPAFTEVAQRNGLAVEPNAGMQWPARNVRRDILDTLLLDRARASGVTIVTGRARSIAKEDSGIFRVEIEKNAQARRAAFVIDATGAAQWLRRQFKLPRQVLSVPLVCRRGLARREKDVGWSPGFYVEKDGWFWIAPTSPEIAVWTHVTTARQRSPQPLPDGFQAEGKAEQAARTWTLVDGVGGTNYAVVGDAAGYLDPASGDGVTLALQSGRNAAITAARILSRSEQPNAAAAAYSDWWYRRIAAKARSLGFFYATHGLASWMDTQPAGVGLGTQDVSAGAG